jgi:hypothetical protein
MSCPSGHPAIDVATAIPAIVALLLIAIPQPARTSTPGTAATHYPCCDLRASAWFILSWKRLDARGDRHRHQHARPGGRFALPLLVVQHFTAAP